MKKLLILILLSIAVTSASAEKINIGVISDLSGSGLLAGERCLRGYKTTISTLQEPEVYEFIYEDSASRPVMAVNAMNKLIKKDQVDAATIFASNNSFAVSPLTTQANLPLVALAGAEKVFTDKFPYNVSSWPSAEQEASKLAKYVYEEGVRTIAIATTENDYPLALREGFIKHFTALGGEITLDEQFIQSETDYKAFITRLRANSAEAVYANLLVNSTGQFLKQLHQYQNQKQVYGTYYLGTKSEIDLAGPEAAEGIRFVSIDINSPAYRRKSKELFPEYPIEVLGFTCAVGMQRLLQATEALRLSGEDVNRQSIHQKIKEQKIVNFFDIKLPTNGKLMEFSYTLQTYKNGQYLDL